MTLKNPKNVGLGVDSGKLKQFCLMSLHTLAVLGTAIMQRISQNTARDKTLET